MSALVTPPPGWDVPADLPRTVVEALLRAGTRWGEDHVLFDFPDADSELTVAGLRAAGEAWAGLLTGCGVAAGDRVAVCLPGHPVWPVLQVACGIVGAAHVGVNVKYRAWEIERLLAIARPTLVITAPGAGWNDDSCAAALVELAAAAGIPTVALGDEADELLARATARSVDSAVATAADAALVQFTSGSTGAPKAVAHTQQQVVLSAHWISALAGYEESDVLYSALPFYHVGGSMCTGPVALVSGARTVVPARFSASGSVATMIEKGATATQGHAAMFTMQIERARTAGVLDGLRLTKGWAAAPPAVVRRVHDELGMTGVVPFYGMSECGMAIGCRSTDPLEKRLTTLGRPVPGVLVRVREMAGGAGELEVRGPGVVAGYVDDPDSTRAAFGDDGFLHTGDVVAVDDDGFLTWVDRYKDMIKPGGENVSTSEVEAFLLSLPHVTGASVVGAPDPVMGEVPVAFVQVDGVAVDATAIVDACRSGIATFKVPAWVDLVAELPLMATGKVDKPALRRRAADRGSSWRPGDAPDRPMEEAR